MVGSASQVANQVRAQKYSPPVTFAEHIDDLREQLATRGGIQSSGGLIQDEHFRPARQCDENRRLALSPAREPTQRSAPWQPPASGHLARIARIPPLVVTCQAPAELLEAGPLRQILPLAYIANPAAYTTRGRPQIPSQHAGLTAVSL